jgi:hypothetical protein
VEAKCEGVTAVKALVASDSAPRTEGSGLDCLEAGPSRALQGSSGLTESVDAVIGENTSTATPNSAEQPTEQERLKFQAWLCQMARGVAADAGVGTDTVLNYVYAAVQRMQSDSLSCENGGPGILMLSGIIADTGATVRGVGRKHISKATNTKQLAQPVQIEGAGGTVRVTEGGDLPIVGPLSGAMNDSLMFYDCVESVLPVVPVCEELDLGYQIAQGGGQARFYKNGETVQVLDKEGHLFTVPTVSDGSKEVWHECEEHSAWGLQCSEVCDDSECTEVQQSETDGKVVSFACKFVVNLGHVHVTCATKLMQSAGLLCWLPTFRTNFDRWRQQP